MIFYIFTLKDALNLNFSDFNGRVVGCHDLNFQIFLTKLITLF